MKSVTKCSLTSDQITKIIQTHIDPAATLIKYQELSEGWFNTAYALDIGGSQKLKLVLKISPPPSKKVLTYEIDAMETEIQANKLISENTNVPIPKIYAEDFSHEIIENNFFLMEFLPGKSWNKLKAKISREINESLEKQIGEYQFAINSISNSYFGSIIKKDLPKNQDWFSVFSAMLQSLYDDLPRFNLPELIPRNIIFNLLGKHHAAFEIITEPRLVHWDLWEGNIFIDKINGNYQITGITDFERAFWGDPLFEFIFWRPLKYPKVISVYGENFISDPMAKIRRSWYNIYMFLIWYLETSSRGYSLWFKIPYKITAIMNLRKEFRFLSYNLLFKND